MKRLSPESTAIAVIDAQERLAAAMPPPALADLIRGASLLLEGARLLGAKAVATEQYAKGLGPTISELAGPLDVLGAPRFEKSDFSAGDVPAFVDRITAFGAEAIVVVGMEAHVCVFQTVRDLVARGFDVYVPADAVTSRRDDHKQAGLALCERAGAIVTTCETIVFDWLRRAGSAEFRALSTKIK
jgi:nicotinamidase-related amidase